MHRYIASASAYCVNDGFDGNSASAADSNRLARKRDNTGGEVGVEETM
jgi:hypothetical protein